MISIEIALFFLSTIFLQIFRLFLVKIRIKSSHSKVVRNDQTLYLNVVYNRQPPKRYIRVSQNVEFLNDLLEQKQNGFINIQIY